mgnify:FL=1
MRLEEPYQTGIHCITSSSDAEANRFEQAQEGTEGTLRRIEIHGHPKFRGKESIGRCDSGENLTLNLCFFCSLHHKRVTETDVMVKAYSECDCECGHSFLENKVGTVEKRIV